MSDRGYFLQIIYLCGVFSFLHFSKVFGVVFLHFSNFLDGTQSSTILAHCGIEVSDICSFVFPVEIIDQVFEMLV